MQYNKTFIQLKPGDTIYFFCYYKNKNNNGSWEDEETPWDYIGEIGGHLVGAPYLGNIHEAKIYSTTRVDTDEIIIFPEITTKDGIKKMMLHVDNKYVNKTLGDLPRNFKPEYNTDECDKFTTGTMVISTSKNELHISWSAVWNDIFNGIEHEMCKLELWKRKLIKWSDMERDKFEKIK